MRPGLHSGAGDDGRNRGVFMEDFALIKIALIAMSGIRACDPEFLRLGLTLPGFVERSKTIASPPSLGLLTLAALTPSRHDVQYIEIPNLAEVNGIPIQCDLAAISSYSAQIGEAAGYSTCGNRSPFSIWCFWSCSSGHTPPCRNPRPWNRPGPNSICREADSSDPWKTPGN